MNIRLAALFGIETSDRQGGALALGTSVDVAIFDDDAPAPVDYPRAPTTSPTPPSAPPSVGGGGSGGSLSWVTLLTLLGLVLDRRGRPAQIRR